MMRSPPPSNMNDFPRHCEAQVAPVKTGGVGRGRVLSVLIQACPLNGRHRRTMARPGKCWTSIGHALVMNSTGRAVLY